MCCHVILREDLTDCKASVSYKIQDGDKEVLIVYLVHFDIKTWEPADCPLCKAGSKRLRPKQYWQELTAKL